MAYLSKTVQLAPSESVGYATTNAVGITRTVNFDAASDGHGIAVTYGRFVLQNTVTFDDAIVPTAAASTPRRVVLIPNTATVTTTSVPIAPAPEFPDA